MTKFCCIPYAAEKRPHIINIVNCNCAVWDNEVPLQHTRGGGSIPLTCASHSWYDYASNACVL